MKTFAEFIEEQIVDEATPPQTHKTDKRGGTVFTTVNPFNKEGEGKYNVVFQPNKESPRGRTKVQTISTHATPDEAESAKIEFAKKHGYNAMKHLKDTE
jgi:hypothetical protein